ncbi:CHAD domain-containing protein, partial [Paracoccus liaowanqingii]
IMSRSEDTILVLAGALADDALGPQVGALDLGVTDLAAEAPFDLLDDFNGSVRGAGQLLIETGRCLILHQTDGVMAQKAGRPGNFVADLAEGPVRAALQRVSPLRSLLSVGSGTISSRQLSLTDDEGKTQVRARLTTLQPKGDGAPVTFAALQGLRGYDRALDALRGHLEAAAAPGADSVAAVAPLLFPAHVPYVAKPDVPVAGDDTAWRAANDIITAYLRVARSNEAGIIADHDTEFLHDYRVALRKVRSVISLFKGVYSDDQTAALKQAASDLMAPTGRLRDLDVYLLARDDYFAMLPASLHQGLELMFAMFAKERRRAHKAVAANLRSAAHDRAMTDLQALFDAPDRPVKGPEADHQVQDYARQLIWKRYRKVCRIAREITAQTPDTQVHELRILCKKLRYLMEFFAPLFPADAVKPLLKPLKALQDNLGLFNDYSVQQVALRDFMEAHEPIGQKQDLVLAQSIGALIAVLHERQKEERARIMSSFALFDSAEVRAEFRTLFHGKEA